MNYLQIDEFDVSNGPGVRVTLWTAGCSHHCKGCQNPESWDIHAGRLFTIKEMDYIKNLLKNPYIKGLTLTGGDPILHNTEDCFINFLKEIKNEYKDKTIWCYTGWTFEEIKSQEILNYIDVLIDGPFEIDKRDITLQFRGSSNQRIINVPASLSQNKIILWNN